MSLHVLQQPTDLHKTQLASLLDSITIDSENAYTVAGEKKSVYTQTPYQHYSKAFSSFGDNQYAHKQLSRKRLIEHISHTLYTEYYCGYDKDHISQRLPSKQARDQFMDGLSQYNQTQQGLDKNWIIYAVDGEGKAYAVKNECLRQVTPNSYVVDPHAPQKPLAVNQRIDFHVQTEDRDSQPTFYCAFGQAYLPSDCEMMRVYWNVKAEGAAPLLQAITAQLNDYRIPFHFKCLNHPDLYHRRDTAVLYFDKTQFSIVSLLLKPIIQAVQAYLNEPIPRFTTPIALGVAWAEDPGQGQSFGMNRTTLIAEALVQAYEEKLTSPNQRDEKVVQWLTEQGIHMHNFSLNPSTSQLNFH